MERAPLESLLGQQIRPSNIDLQLKQVNEEIYSCQGGLMSSARGKDGALKKVNNVVQKSMFPLMRVANRLYLADTTEAEAPSMKAVFDHCMTALTLLCEANLELETLRREAFKPTTPSLYKSLITKPGDSNTLFGDSMEDQMKFLENKENSRKPWSKKKHHSKRLGFPLPPLPRGTNLLARLPPQTGTQKTGKVSPNQP